MIAPIRIPTRNQAQPIVDNEGRATAEFHGWLNSILRQFAYVLNEIVAIPEIQTALEGLDAATAAAQAAADNANNAAMAVTKETALQSSYIDPDSVLTATPTTITVAPHTRHYGDGTSALVNGGSVPATASGDVDYVSYSDPSRSGGTVTYIVSTTAPVQTGNIHVVGAVTIPATGTANGGSGPQKPGFVEPT